MFATPVLAPIETRCRVFPARTGSRGVRGGLKRIVYDFAPVPLHAISHGVLAVDRERRVAWLRDRELHRPFLQRADHVTRCWQWFAATHPGGDTTIDVHLDIDEHGATGALRTNHRLADAELASCVRDGFVAPIYIDPPRSHGVIIQTTLRFERADQPAWPRTPTRPAPITHDVVPERGTSCVHVSRAPVAQRLPPLLVSDFDRSRIPPPPPNSRRSEPPAIRVGCAFVSDQPRKRDIAAALRSNTGAYEACHAAARERDPALAGTVTATLLFDIDGAEPPLASVSGDGDAELHACLDRALEDIWLDPPTRDSLTEVHVTFDLVTSPAPAQRSREDWRVALAHATSPREACRLRAALAEDRMAAAPWIDDARVRAAMHELATFIASLPAADAAACLSDTAKLLAEYTQVTGGDLVRGPVPSAEHERRARMLDRLEAVLPLAAIAPWGPALRQVVGAIYRRDPARHAEGMRMLRELAQRGPDGATLVIDETPMPINNSCAF